MADLVLDSCDRFVLTPYLYPASFDPSDWRRQLLSLILITTISAYVIYFTCSTFSYFFIFDRSLMQHPKFLKNQVGLEIQCACMSIPFAATPTAAVFLLEVRGYSKLYYGVEGGTYGCMGIHSV